MLAAEIEKRISEWLKQNTNQIDETTWKCKRCEHIIQGQGKRLPVHEAYSLFKGTHAGGGEVKEIVFPYCPKCDSGIEHFNDITCIDF